MKALILSLALMLGAAAAIAGPATNLNPRAEAPSYRVVEPNASIGLAHYRVRGYEVGRDNSLILRVTGNRYYRATLQEPCASDLRYGTSIGFRTFGGTLGRSERVYVNGTACYIRSLDQIERPVRATVARNDVARLYTR